MSFYGNQTERMVESATPGIHLHTITNLAETPQVNIIIVHGLSSYAKSYDPFASFLVKHDCNVFRYDQPGHGKSEGPRGYMDSLADLYENLHVMVRRTKMAYPNLPLFVIGHSMGGETVLLYGIKYPQTVDGFVVADPVSIVKAPNSWSKGLTGDPKKQLPNVLSTGLNSDPRVVHRIQNDPANLHHLTVGILQNEIKGAYFLREHLTGFKDPLLFLQGQKDGLIDYHDSLEAYAMIASNDKELHVYSSLMHNIFDEPQRKWDIYSEVVQWINRHRY